MAFENTAVMQSRIAGTLERNIKDSLLPQSLLFAGHPGSGRLTAALDLAFYLTGERRDILRSASVIYFPSRPLSARVKAALSIFSRDRSDASRLFLLETMRLVNMQYNAVLAPLASSSTSSLFQKASAVDEFLCSIEERREITDGDVKALESLKIAGDDRYLYNGKKNPSAVSIDQLRLVKEWMSSGSGEKVVIIEDIESATEGAKNSILKMLEEPEEHFTIILVSSESQRIMETILSRVRKFNFPPLTEERISSLLKSRFNHWEDYPSFDAFYFCRGNDSASVEACDRAVKDTADIISCGTFVTREKEEELNTLLENLSAYSYFRLRLTQEIESRLISGKISPVRARRILSILRSWSEGIETYNMSERAALDYIIRESQIAE